MVEKQRDHHGKLFMPLVNMPLHSCQTVAMQAQGHQFFWSALVLDKTVDVTCAGRRLYRIQHIGEPAAQVVLNERARLHRQRA